MWLSKGPNYDVYCTCNDALINIHINGKVLAAFNKSYMVLVLELWQLLLQVIEKLTTWNADNAFTPELAPDINRSTVFGLLLGYPVVYWYRNVVTADNCLSHVPLRLFRILAVDSTADSQPTAIYSFTVPEQLYSHCQSLIDSWQKQLLTLASRPCTDWVYSLHADCQTIVQSVVCMWCWHYFVTITFVHLNFTWIYEIRKANAFPVNHRCS